MLLLRVLLLLLFQLPLMPLMLFLLLSLWGCFLYFTPSCIWRWYSLVPPRHAAPNRRAMGLICDTHA